MIGPTRAVVQHLIRGETHFDELVCGHYVATDKLKPYKKRRQCAQCKEELRA